ncbi:MAG: FHA domain-containing protein [Myxococcales bacterium]|nr:MAG: FHA domain-containing protein [Myxococcales bacterium]
MPKHLATTDHYVSMTGDAVSSEWDPTLTMQLVCSGCSIENPSHMRFCKQCGTRLSVIDPEGRLEKAPLTKPALAQDYLPEEGRLVSVGSNGVDGKTYPLTSNQIDIGSQDGDVIFGDDPYLSARHARFLRDAQGFRVIDLASVNGVFLRVKQSVPLEQGDTILIGQQVLRFEIGAKPSTSLGPAFRRGVKVFGTPEVSRLAWLVQYITEGVDRDAYCLYREETILGRESGDIVFTDDPFLSRRHASITYDADKKGFSLTDLGSSNGTGLKIRGESRLRSGDQIRIGRQLLRFELLNDVQSEERYD